MLFRSTTNSKHSQLSRIHNTIANLTTSTTHLERFDHTANPPWFQPPDANRLSINIPLQKKEEIAESHTNLTNTLANNPSHLLLYTDGLQIRTGSNGTGLVAIHAQYLHTAAVWNIEKHVEIYDTELFRALQVMIIVDHGLNCEPCCSIGKQSELCVATTIRFTP